MSYMIRPAEGSDAAGVYAVEKECFPDPYPAVLLDDLIEKEQSRFFVAVEHGKIIGYTVATSDGRDGRIVSVAVDPRYRRRGIGKALLSAVTRKLTEESVAEVHLEVRKGNAVAICFYERMGFRRVSEIKHYYADGEDAWVLRRSAEPLLSSSS